jgi:hyperosmotically inducible periplasmic protein
MRQFAAVVIFSALFLLLVGSRFKASDGDKLVAVARLTTNKLRDTLPPELNVAAPVDALRKGLPTRADDAVRARLTADKRFAGIDFRVSCEGAVVTLRGVVPDARAKRLAVGVAQNTIGVDEVIDELAVPE